MHTWKGEFGVLDLQEYSKLIHSFEEKLEEKDFAAESLFRLKDFLTAKLCQFSAGEMPKIDKKEKNYLFQPKAKGEPSGPDAQSDTGSAFQDARSLQSVPAHQEIQQAKNYRYFKAC